MKIFHVRTFVLVTVACLFLAGCGTVENPFRVSIVPETRTKDGSYITWANDSNRCFFVLLNNLTKESQPVFEMKNSWGYQTISFEFLLPDGRKTKVAMKPKVFTRNTPSTSVIPPNGHQVFPITLSDEWTGKPDFREAGETNVTIKAIYELSTSPEAKEQGVWIGRIESEPMEVRLRHW